MGFNSGFKGLIILVTPHKLISNFIYLLWYASAKNKRQSEGNNEKYNFSLPEVKIPNEVKLLKNLGTHNFVLAYRTEFLWLRKTVALQLLNCIHSHFVTVALCSMYRSTAGDTASSHPKRSYQCARESRQLGDTRSGIPSSKPTAFRIPFLLRYQSLQFIYRSDA